MNYSFHPAAEAEFLESVAYYESKVDGLGKAFVEEVESILLHINDFPKSYKVELEPGIRSATLSRFPLSIIYQESHIGLQILAIAHQKRRPYYWQGR